MKARRVRHALQMAYLFWGFQAASPVLGWLAGIGLEAITPSFYCWMALGMLSAVSIKMMCESFKIEEAEEEAKSLAIYLLLILSIATSIEALAVEHSFAFLKISIFTPGGYISEIHLVTMIEKLLRAGNG